MTEVPPSIRREERSAVAMGARCRTLSGIRDVGAINDLSQHGCCVTMRALRLSVGSRVIVKPDGLEGIIGIVRWIAGDKAGVEFEHPLYGPIVDHISQQHGARSGSVSIVSR